MLGQMEPGVGRGIIAGIFGFLVGAVIPAVSMALFSPYASYADESLYIWMGLIAGGIGFVWGMFGPATFKVCPYCREQVKPDATVCKHCGRDLPR